MYASSKITKEVIPAHLGFLTIYNPSLGTGDESVESQIIYYYPSHNREDAEPPRATNKKIKDNDYLKQQTDEQMRQIGLAQGIIEFGKSFSGGKPVKTIDTEKSRIILHEFEPSWWILASINLTIIPCNSGATACSKQEKSNEYSSRDVKPAELLLMDLLRAQSTFLLHHTSSISELFLQTKRSRFQRILSRYWDLFIARWNVLMHGNPAHNLYLGIKIAACGELGIGVGEEHRGSAEREVLEGFTHQVKGMVDIVVSKFSDERDSGTLNNEFFDEDNIQKSWIGNGRELNPEDGAILLGTGYLSRKSIRDISYWIEDIYRWGIYAYGIIDDPASSGRLRKSRKGYHSERKNLSSETHRDVLDVNRRRKKKNLSLEGQTEAVQGSLEHQSTIQGSSKTPNTTKHLNDTQSINCISKIDNNLGDNSDNSSTLTYILKLGYGSYKLLGKTWSKGEADNLKAREVTPSSTDLNLKDSNCDSSTGKFNSNKSSFPKGRFLIGLTDNIEDSKITSRGKQTENKSSYIENLANFSKISRRKLVLELEHNNVDSIEARDNILTENLQHSRTSRKSYKTEKNKKTESHQVVIYASNPFIFTFIFKADLADLECPDFYRMLHHQIQQIVDPLLSSTKYRIVKPEIKSDSPESPIFDLIWDPKNLTISSTIPNIPNISEIYASSSGFLPWSGPEALNTHIQIIKTYVASRDSQELERICKTSRGWWIIWTKILEPVLEYDGKTSQELNFTLNKKTARGKSEMLEKSETNEAKLDETKFLVLNNDTETSDSSQDTDSNSQDTLRIRKEILLIRRTGDHILTRSMSGFSNPSSIIGSERGWSIGPNSLFQEIGVDTRQYIERLLNLTS
ncbi:putative vacuolar fusion protein ccz1 protein [Erysiphe neolycopersici]|uniref:Putative vacuolar fusion protein ccz1 protein n=1 Tax=Erysiphe neolycopersici TaxID=212602 RepID=A0A420HY71_9PEZI|nr:putative vacuolar fusion protein ccz1 protein [Erysiphe neolycopersici]